MPSRRLGTCTGNGLGHQPPTTAGFCRKDRQFIHLFILAVVSISAIYAVFLTGRFPITHHVPSPVTGLSLPGVAAAVVPSEQAILRSSVVPLTTAAEHQDEALSSTLSEPAAPTADETMMIAASVPPVVATPEPPKPPFFIYTVQEGDTVGGLASRFGIATTSILWNNLDLENADELSVGQQIRVPNSDGIVYEVRLGDTLTDLAAYFDVDVQDILNFPGNGLSDVDDIIENQTIFIPNGTLPAPAEPTPEVTDIEPDDPYIEPSVPAPATDRPASASGLIWPVTGRISSYFGPSHPLGIDIDQFHSPGAPVYASAAGTVTFAGGQSCCSYGLYIVIDHGNGLETLYAHLASFTVSQGDYVEQGQVIGYVGLTGYTTGYHLHFEVHLNGQVVNPLNYLP